jgi:hypothetical protein
MTHSIKNIENVTMNVAEFVNYITALKGCHFAYIIANVPQKMNKRGNPFNEITKHTETTIQIGYSYENSVNNRGEKIGLDRDFVAQPLSWGKWLKHAENKIIVHTPKDTNEEKFYLRTYAVNNNEPKNSYFTNGNLLTNEELEIAKQFFVERKKSKTQSNYGLEENQVKPSTFEINNIVEIHIGGKVITIEK